MSHAQDRQGMTARLEEFLEWTRARNYSEQTIRNNRICISYFIRWCEERGITRPTEVTQPILERYQLYLYHYRNPQTGKPLSFRSQTVRLSPVRSFFTWLTRHHVILYNPTHDLEFPKGEKRLPRHILTVSEAEQVLNQPDVKEPLGIRDRAILETLYSTGMRRLELLRLCVYDLDGDRGTVLIRQGKGKKDRLIPIGERALAWCTKYMDEVRPELVVYPDEHTLFLTHAGVPFKAKRLTQLAYDTIKAAHIGKQGSCHIFRHTMATLMLEHGADIRYIQQMLGHADVSSTQIYTQVSISKLKEIHTATHPGACLYPKESSARWGHEEERAHLFSALTAELDDEDDDV